MKNSIVGGFHHQPQIGIGQKQMVS